MRIPKDCSEAAIFLMRQSGSLQDGLCQNLSRTMTCTYSSVGEAFDCTDKRNCIKLTGLFQCSDGLCTQAGLT